ncbi:MAG: tRNA lysidine(34) synthetase TilS, partial [Oscillospiraceae bacterium]|nr:tRNA lysidine(34) synthetase TilS [Oscillospiraceae bacterium]
MKDKVLATIKANQMLKQGDRVIVGLSGGADSVALLCVLLQLKDELGITLSAVHVNHCLRGEESDRDELFCQKLCAEKGINFTAHRINVKSYCEQHKVGTEEGARALRYSIFEESDPTAKIATAHTLSDNAETVIMNLARGSALDGLCGIPPVRGRIIRPIIDCSRSDVEEFLAKLGQSYVTDSTNLTDDYSRNRVRHNVIPILKQLNPELERSVKRSCDALREDRMLLDSMAQKAIEAAALPEKAAPKGFDRLKTLFDERKTLSIEMVKAQPQPIRMRIYKILLNQFSQSCDAARLTQIDELVQSGEGVYPLGKAVSLSCNGGKLYIERKAA